MAATNRPSLLGGLIWVGLGVLFLMMNFGWGPDFWTLAGRYWPILLILLGLGKVIEYFGRKEGVSIRAGEVVGIILLLLVGTAVTKIADSRFGEVLGEIPVRIGGRDVSPGQWLGTSYTYTDEVSYPIDAPTPIRIENAYGLVSVSPGGDREVRVRLRKVVYHNEEERAQEIANEIRLDAGPEGKAEAASFLVRTNRDTLASKEYRFNTDMEVSVPKNAKVQIRNSYGEVKVGNLEGPLDVGGSHKSMDIRDCSGEVVASNRFGELRLLNQTGNVKVDARGRVYLESVRGDVEVRNEYSPVELRDIDGKVTVTNTEGSVTLDTVTKPVIVEARGSQVTARNLSDRLRVSTSHRQVRVTDAAADVSVESRYSTVTLKNVRGNVEIASNSDRLNLDDIRGSLKIDGKGSSVRVNSVEGATEIHSTLKDIIVNNFGGTCKITNEYAEVSLSSSDAPRGEISVQNRNGDIELVLPEEAAFQIEATARNGRVRSEFPQLLPAESGGDRGVLRGSQRTGGPKITLETENSDIQVRTRGERRARR